MVSRWQAYNDAKPEISAGHQQPEPLAGSSAQGEHRSGDVEGHMHRDADNRPSIPTVMRHTCSLW